MKHNIISLIVVLVGLQCPLASMTSCLASEDSDPMPGIFKSKPVNNIFVAVTGKSRLRTEIQESSYRPRADEALLVQFMTTLSEDKWAYMPIDPEYRALIQLVGPRSDEVKKSALGRSFGRRFHRLRDFKDTRMASTIIMSPQYGVLDRLSGSRPFPAVEELFNLREPGEYRLKLEFQIFVPAEDMQEQVLTRLPPVELTVVKQ